MHLFPIHRKIYPSHDRTKLPYCIVAILRPNKKLALLKQEVKRMHVDTRNRISSVHSEKKSGKERYRYA